jgi:quinol-cytochrome oxidoreductase complex cytochrome b subunit
METKLNKKELFCGLLSGFLANLLGMIIVGIVLFQNFNILKIINDSISETFITKLISLGAIVNLIVFFIFLKYDYEERAKGVLLATFIIAILTIYINNF